jgi:hypothetical protein
MNVADIDKGGRRKSTAAKMAIGGFSAVRTTATHTSSRANGGDIGFQGRLVAPDFLRPMFDGARHYSILPPP